MGGNSGRKVKTAGSRVRKRSPALFLHEPRTEQEVVCLFGALLADLGMVIERVQTPFPDCTVRQRDTGEKLRIEFELNGSSFKNMDIRSMGATCWCVGWMITATGLMTSPWWSLPSSSSPVAQN